jgi:hypothetical protein
MNRSNTQATLTTAAFIAGSWLDRIDLPSLPETSWQEFASTWDDMPVDAFMGDEGRYRQRRFSEFRVNVATRSLERLPHVPYRQSKEDNYLNGGIDRHYEPMIELAVNNKVFRQTLLCCAAIVGESQKCKEYLVQVFQNRILAGGSLEGRPTPEGIHRDGVHYVLSLLLSRVGVRGGCSQLFRSSGEHVEDFEMSRRGDFILLDDEATRHSVTPIHPEAQGGSGHRDVMIAMFTAWTPNLR